MLPAYQDWWNSSTKFFGIRDELLRKIDHTLQAYHALAGESVQHQICLADLLAYTARWLRDNPRSSRLRAVEHLHDAADQDVSAECGGFFNWDLRRWIGGDALSDWTVRVRLLRTANVERLIQPDLNRASEIWLQAGVVVTTEPANAQAEQLDLALLDDGLTLGYVGEGQLVHHVNLDQGFIHCCYARRISGDGAAGKTERPGDHAGHLFDPLIKIGADLARAETLAHELGHALLNDGSHHFDPRNLMAAGVERKGAELTPGQIVMARRSLYARA